MKILVLSDSHGYLEHMRRAIAEESPQYIIHLGDHCEDVQSLNAEYPMLQVLTVRGNCDLFDFDVPETVQTVYDGVRIMAVHGHRYGVKSSLLRLAMAAKERAVQIALFGHTHCAYCEKYDDIWLLNPGSCNAHGRGTYGVIEITNGSFLCTVRAIITEEWK